MRLRALLLLSALIALGLTTAPAPAQGTCPGARTHVGSTGTWTELPTPPLAGALTVHAVDATDPGRWWVTDGQQALRSVDAGCHWSTAYTLPTARTAVDPLGPGDTITGISLAAHGQALLAVHLRGDATLGSRPVFTIGLAGGAVEVVRSDDDGRSWSDPVLATAGEPGPLVTAPSDPRRVYAVGNGALATSSDGGETWTQRGFPEQAGHAGELTPGVVQIVVDPLRPDILWAKGASYLARSGDAGASWALRDAGEPHDPRVGQGLLSLAHPKDGLPLRIDDVYAKYSNSRFSFLFTAQPDTGAFLSRSSDTVGQMGGTPQSVAGGRHRGDLVITTTHDPDVNVTGPPGLFRIVDGLSHDVDEFRLAPLLDARASGVQDRFSFRSRKGLVRWDLPGSRTVSITRPPLVVVPPFATPPVPAAVGGSLLPATDDLTLDVGASTRRTLLLREGRRPAQLDLAFSLDTSTSTEPFVRGVALGMAQLARQLAGSGGSGVSGVDAQFALTEFQDRDGLRYRRLSDLRPPDAEFQRSFEDIELDGGFEPDYTALQQLAAGTGVTRPSTGRPVAAGQQVHWRPGATHVVVHVTDEAFSSDPDGASRDLAVAALRTADAHVIGLQVRSPQTIGIGPVTADPGPAFGLPTAVVDATGSCPVADPGEASTASGGAYDVELYCQLVDLAGATQALAPAGGVDCTGDGRQRIAAGRPLVCVLMPTAGDKVVAIAGPVLRLVTGFGAPGAVRVDALSDNRFVRAEVLGRPRNGAVSVRYACLAGGGGATGSVSFTATSGGSDIATSEARVTCLRPSARTRTAPDGTDPVTSVPGTGPEPVSPVLSVAAPPPAPVTGNAAAPAPAAAPGPALAAAVLPQDQVQPQLALAGHDDDVPALAALSLSLVTATAAGAFRLRASSAGRAARST